MHNHCGLVSTFASGQYCFTYFGFRTYPGNYIFCFIDKISRTHLQVEYFIAVIYTRWQKLKCKAKNFYQFKNIIWKFENYIEAVHNNTSRTHKKQCDQTERNNYQKIRSLLT